MYGKCIMALRIFHFRIFLVVINGQIFMRSDRYNISNGFSKLFIPSIHIRINQFSRYILLLARSMNALIEQGKKLKVLHTESSKIFFRVHCRILILFARIVDYTIHLY